MQKMLFGYPPELKKGEKSILSVLFGGGQEKF
jgi:hypothetical protein